MFEGKYSIEVNQLREDLWVGRAEQNGVAVISFLRRYNRPDGTMTMFGPNISRAEFSQEKFQKLIEPGCLKADKALREGKVITRKRQDGSEYSYAEVAEGDFVFRARPSKSNPINTVVIWRAMQGPVAGLNGMLTVANGTRGRHVVAQLQQGYFPITASFVQSKKVVGVIPVKDDQGDIVKDENGQVETDLDTEHPFYVPVIRSAVDAIAYYNQMMFTQAINDHATAQMAKDAPPAVAEAVPTAAASDVPW